MSSKLLRALFRLATLDKSEDAGRMSHHAHTRPVIPPQSKSSRSHPTKSPFLVPLPEDNLPVQDEDIFSLDARFVDEPFRLDEDDTSDTEEDDEDKGEEAVHLPGVPKSTARFDAKRYTTPDFARQLFALLRDELRLPGWSELAAQLDPTTLSIFKVSGALTNAVFFVSCPLPEAQSPPTVLVRVYGPSSDSLLSRKLELHVLHTLSAEYQFGPHVLGTFANGRVEEYFESKALNKQLIRDPRLSCWIARRMKELHSVNPELMRLPDARSPALRPMMSHRNSSNISLLSTSSTSSVFSFGSSVSSSSLSSRSRTPSRQSSISGSLPRNSGVYEVPPAIKRRASHISPQLRPTRRKRTSDQMGVWLNIGSWLREGGKVLKLVDQVDSARLANGHKVAPNVHPLTSAATFKAFIASLDLPRFEREVKAYRSWVSKYEKENGRAKRVFAHNDAQYGNVLLRSGLSVDSLEDPKAAMQEIELTRAHELLIVVDFEYAALNPRGFDIANHFLEWKADYHTVESYDMVGPYPTLHERRRFYRAYVGCDAGDDQTADQEETGDENEDPRVLRLEAEVQVWTPASHAMWIVWALVQARDQVQAKVDEWLEGPVTPPDVGLRREDTVTQQKTPPSHRAGLRDNLRDRFERSKEKLNKMRGPTQRIGPTEAVEPSENGHAEPERPPLERGKSGEGQEGDDEFDYLLYARGRLLQFRKLLEEMDVEEEE